MSLLIVGQCRGLPVAGDRVTISRREVCALTLYIRGSPTVVSGAED